MVSKRLVLQTRENQGLFGKGLSGSGTLCQKSYLLKTISSPDHYLNLDKLSNKMDQAFYRINLGISPVPADKILAFSKLKAFADNKGNVSPNTFIFHKVENIGKRRKCFLPVFYSFPKCFIQKHQHSVF